MVYFLPLASRAPRSSLKWGTPTHPKCTSNGPSGQDFNFLHEIGQKADCLRVLNTGNPLNSEEIADRVDRIVCISDAGVGVADEKVAITDHLAVIDRLIVGEAHLVRLIGAPDGAVFGFRLPRLVKLDREAQAHHFLAEVDPFAFGIPRSSQPFSAAFQVRAGHGDVRRLTMMLSHCSNPSVVQVHPSCQRCWE